MMRLEERKVESTETARQAIARAQAAAQEERWQDALDAYAAAYRRAARDQAGDAVHADALRGAGVVRMAIGDWVGAALDFESSRDLARYLGDVNRIGRAENALGGLEFERGDWDAAVCHYAAARERAAESEDLHLLAQVENNEGALWAARGDPDRAEECFRRAITHFEALAEHPCAGRAFNNLGLALVAQRRLPEAMLAYDRALTECKKRGDGILAAKILINRARLSLVRDEPLHAHASAMTAWAFARKLDDGPVAAGAMCLLGEISRALEDHGAATRYLQLALKQSVRGKAPLVEAETWVQIGNLYDDQKRPEHAVDAWENAQIRYRALGALAPAQNLEERIWNARQQQETPRLRISA
jgi:tetratricopeptide (TPR) repeat protein